MTAPGGPLDSPGERDAVRLVLVRHAESEANIGGRWQGQGDSPLSERGKSQARALAERMILEGGATADERLATGYRLACARKADAESLATLRGGLESRLAEFRARPEEAAKLIAHGDSKPAAGLDPAELAAYTVTANLLLNLDRVVTRD